jgi:hypothetical protein
MTDWVEDRQAVFVSSKGPFQLNLNWMSRKCATPSRRLPGFRTQKAEFSRWSDPTYGDKGSGGKGIQSFFRSRGLRVLLRVLLTSRNA